MLDSSPAIKIHAGFLKSDSEWLLQQSYDSDQEARVIESNFPEALSIRARVEGQARRLDAKPGIWNDFQVELEKASDSPPVADKIRRRCFYCFVIPGDPSHPRVKMGGCTSTSAQIPSNHVNLRAQSGGDRVFVPDKTINSIVGDSSNFVVSWDDWLN